MLSKFWGKKCCGLLRIIYLQSIAKILVYFKFFLDILLKNWIKLLKCTCIYVIWDWKEKIYAVIRLNAAQIASSRKDYDLFRISTWSIPIQIENKTSIPILMIELDSLPYPNSHGFIVFTPGLHCLSRALSDVRRCILNHVDATCVAFDRSWGTHGNIVNQKIHNYRKNNKMFSANM